MQIIMSVLDIIGTIAFSISGALVAIKNGLDVFGVVSLGVVTAVGGGVIRDCILGVFPVSVFTNYSLIIISIIFSAITCSRTFRRIVSNHSKTLLIMDSLGLATFTAVGTANTLEYHNFLLSIFCGLLTAVGGGVLRDLFSGCKPNIFVRHFYACASLIGSFFVASLYKLQPTIITIIGAVIVFILRLLAAKYNWNLPHVDQLDNE